MANEDAHRSMLHPGDPAGVARTASTGRGARSAARTVWRVAAGLLLVGALIVGWPQLSAAVDVLRSAERGPLLMALTCQLGAMALLALSYRSGLATAGADVSWRPACGIALRAAAVSRLLPGGGAAAAVFAVRRLRQAGVPYGPAAAGVAVNGVVTMTALVALVAVVGGSTTGRIWVVSATAGAMLFAAGSRRSIGRQRLGAVAARLRGRPSLRVWAAALDTFASGPVSVRRLAAAAGWATAAWTCELAALWLAVAAVARPLPLAAVALALGAANAAAALPHTPGGLGVVEAAMAGALVTTGLDGGVALGAVLAYRAVGYCLPVSVGVTLMAADGLGSLAGRRRVGAVASP